MNTAYVVMYRDYDITKVYAVGLSREAAQEYVDNYTISEGSYGFDAQGPGDLHIEEVELV